MSETDKKVSSSVELRAKSWGIDPNIGCDHWFVYEEICCQCKSPVNNSNARAFTYFANSLQLSREAMEFIKQKRSEIYLSMKKLHLVLDLDHTLVHTLEVSQLSEAEEYLVEEADSRDDLWRIKQRTSGEFLIKLRPFVREFLREASKLFSMYVYTMGGPVYAETVVKLLDPRRSYFGRRVITKRDSGKLRKTLDLVLAEERHVVIVDDRREVWPDHGSNLIEITSYDYFKEKGSLRSYAEKRRDEGERDGALASVLKNLKKAHRGFFDEACEQKLCLRDVRPWLHP